MIEVEWTVWCDGCGEHLGGARSRLDAIANATESGWRVGAAGRALCRYCQADEVPSLGEALS